MTTPANIKRFKIKHPWKDYEVTVEVNMDRLTPERAALINSFWTGADGRLAEEDDCVVRTVIRMAGHDLICAMLEDRGAEFTTKQKYIGERFSKELHNTEGWGGDGEGDGFGWCGIRVVAADVPLPDFDEVALSAATL